MKNFSGIELRQEEVRGWLKKSGFRGEYLLISTKSDSIYSKKLTALKTDQKIIIDLYTPIFLEKELTLSKWKPQDWLTRFRNKEIVTKFLRRGNHFLVANRRQRGYWIKTSGDLGVKLEKNDISVLPTGASRFQVSGFRFQTARRNVVLWFGGIYPWMDPGPLIEAFSKVSPKFPEWKLRFLGGFHPDTGYSKKYNEIQSLALAKIQKSQVEFIPWQQERNLSKYFEEVAFAVHLPKQTPEDYYAHRVRLLTLFSAGVPILTAGRDLVSDLAARLGAAAVTKLDKEDVEKDLISLINFSGQLDKMSKCCLRVGQAFIKQETDIRLNDLNHLTFA